MAHQQDGGSNLKSMVVADSISVSWGAAVQHAHAWRRLLPAFISVMLVGWLLWRVSWQELLQAAMDLDLRRLVPLTALLVIILYSWDSLCVKYVFDQMEHAPRYTAVLRVRGASYLAGAVNYTLGQGMLAWLMARTVGSSFSAALGRLALLAYHDLLVLTGLGLLAASFSSDPRLMVVGICYAATLGVLLLLGMMLRPRLLGWLGFWTWGSVLRLCLLRTVNCTVSILYASAALKLVGIPAQLSALCTAIPLIQLSEGLPITLSGLGTREAILLYLLQPDRTEPILAFGLLWSTELVVGRLAIGLGLMWFGAMPGRFGDEGQGVSKRLPQKPGVSTTD